MNAKDKNVLIIDDDARNIFALKATLASRGFTCYTAQSAPDGIALLQKMQGMKIVLMDMMMPEMDGYEALKVIRGDSTTRDIPVIAVTAQAMVGDRERCIAAGADDYISKPINVDDLLIKLDKY